jgi:nanoRNase/pAp phosphatase (c-di-AMP/oligoRNAs hydrolase)
LRNYSRLAGLLRKSKATLVIGHQNADPDAVCSAYALSILISALNRRARVTFTSPDGVSKLSKQLLQSIPLKVVADINLANVDLVVTVDTNTLQQLGELQAPIANSGKPLVMIDHHASHPQAAQTATLVVCDDKSTSTCEIILDMYQKLRIPLKKTVSQALLVGMMVETGHLSISTKRTFRSACTLIDAGADPAAALSAIRPVMDESERIARVKSAQRMRLERIDGWLVVLSEIGSYHASAARAILAVGAHLVVVAGKRNDQLTMSFRSTHEFFAQTGLHLGTDIAAPLGQKLGGMGGGHATAAGVNAETGDTREALNSALLLIRDLLARRRKQNSTTA